MRSKRVQKTKRGYFQRGRYLGYIEEADTGERYAVIKNPEIDEIFYLFSPDLSLRDLKNAETVYQRDPLMPDHALKILEESGVESLRSGDEVLYSVYGGVVQEITKQNDKHKRVEVTSNNQDFLTGELHYIPSSLKKQRIVPNRNLTAYGQIVDEIDSKILVVDAGIYLQVDISGGQKTKWNWKEFKQEAEDDHSLGDWVKVEFYRIYFQEIIK